MLSFMPVFWSTSEGGFLRRSSALEYSVQTFALRDPYLALKTTLQAPSQSWMRLYLMANLPHSASLSWKMALIFDDY
jgi:hypothetical protein